MNLQDLALPFPAEDIEWRVQHAGQGRRGIYALVIPYITARAIQRRLDEVCEPQNWRLEEPRVLNIGNKPAFACGLSINVVHDTYSEWVTKWDVCEPTNIEPAKGGWSGAIKRSGAQWGIGRYLYYLDAVFAEVVDQEPSNTAREWTRATYGEQKTVYWWKAPGLPGWALPKDPEHEINLGELNDLKVAWKQKFASDVKNPADLRNGFTNFVEQICGEFPAADYTCWTREALERCKERIEKTTEPNGVSVDVPFE